MKKPSTFYPLLLCALLTGCAQSPSADQLTQPQHSSDKKTSSMLSRMAELQRERAANPNNLTLRAEQNDLMHEVVNRYLKQAEQAVQQNHYQLAAEKWQNVLVYQPGNLRALQGLHKLDAWRALDVLYTDAVKQTTRDPEMALRKVQQVLEEDPNWPKASALRNHLLREIAERHQPENRLSRELQKPVSLNFRQHNLIAIFHTLTQLTGVNIIFDKDIPTSATGSLIAKNTTAENAIDVLLMSNNLRKKILNDKTLIIYPATPQKEKIYRDVVVKTVFLGYAKAKEVNVALRNMVKLKDVHVDERTNSITMRGPAESVQKAERLLVTLDRPEAEVTLAVEVLEVNASDVEALGVNWPQKISASFSEQDGENKTKGQNIPLKSLSTKSIFIGVDNMSIDLKTALSNAKVLANPRIRVKNNKKALIDIGETIPVLTSSVSDGFSQQKVEYQDVGLKLEVTPDISVDDGITMDVKFNLSTLGAAEKGENDTVYYRTNKREANTILSSRNGETQMLAGLIKQDDTSVDSGIPYLSKIPGLGRLFGSKATSKQRTEVILLITPTIERNLDLPGSHISTIDMGTDDLTGESLQLQAPQGPSTEMFDLPPLAPPAQFPAQNATLPSPVVEGDPLAQGAH